MNTSKLTLAQQCKALSDAAEYNRIKAQICLVDNAKSKKHLADAELYAAECRRLQQSLNNQRK